MEPIVQFDSVWGEIKRWFAFNLVPVESLFSEWSLIQMAVIAAAVILALFVARLVTPTIETRLRTIKGRPQLLRFLAILLRRLHLIALSFLLWTARGGLLASTWPTRSNLISVAATLISAWVIISVASRVLRNRTASRVLAIAAWLIAALHILGLLGPAIALLDDIPLGVGNVSLSLWGLIKAALILTALLWFGTALSALIDRRLLSSDDLTPSLQVLISKIIKIVLIGFAIVVALGSIGVDLTAFAVFSGAVGLGIGFGLQKVVSNLFAGIIILLDKSIKPGDVISLGETFGWINSLRARYVSVVTRDGREYLIPNEDLITQQVVNWSFTDRAVRLECTFGVAYQSDPHLVRKTAMQAASACRRVGKTPAPVCHVTGFGDSSIDFVLRFWVSDPEAGVANIRGEVLLAVWDAFKEHGIAFPYPHRELIVQGPIKIEQVP